MSEEKSLIDLARTHMEKAGLDPNSSVDLENLKPEPTPEPPAKVSTAPAPVSEAQTVDVVDTTYAEALKSLLVNVETTQAWRRVSLPSRGKAYIQCEEFVEIRPFTFAEERKLRSMKNAKDGEEIIRSLFNACVRGLDHDSMTLFDKNYLLFKLREISYGDEYTIEPECQHCSAQNKLSVLISEVPVNYVPDDYTEPFKVVLPDSQQEVTFVSPRSKDEFYMQSIDKLTDNLWRFMVSVGKYTDEKLKKAFIENTTVKDVAFLREKIVSSDYGMQLDMSFTCANCDEVSKAVIPLNEYFFSVS